MAYSYNLESNLYELLNELRNETYKVGKYRKFYIKEPKIRLISALHFKDRIVQWSIYRILNPFYDKMFIHDSYACRKGKGSFKALDRLQYWLKILSNNNYSHNHEKEPASFYYLKIDISKFFYTINHQVLMNILLKRIKDKKLYNLINEIVNNKQAKFGLPPFTDPEDCPYSLWRYDVGLPIGNLTSQLFANLYMNELDQFCKHILKIKYYMRYMDDVLILGTKEELKSYFPKIKEFINIQLKLNLNRKTVLRPIKNGIEFVGYIVFPFHRYIRKNTRRRMVRYVKHQVKKANKRRINTYDLFRTIDSYNGMFSRCNSYNIRNKLFKQLELLNSNKDTINNIKRRNNDIILKNKNKLEKQEKENEQKRKLKQIKKNIRSVLRKE